MEALFTSRRRTARASAAALLGAIVLCGALPISVSAQGAASVTLSIELSSGQTHTYNVPLVASMTVEDALKAASTMSPPFKWTAVWYGSLNSYQVVAFDNDKNEDPTNPNARFWQFCIGPKGDQQQPSQRGISLMGLAPNDQITWKLAKYGSLDCPKQ